METVRLHLLVTGRYRDVYDSDDSTTTMIQLHEQHVT